MPKKGSPTWWILLALFFLTTPLPRSESISFSTILRLGGISARRDGFIHCQGGPYHSRSLGVSSVYFIIFSFMELAPSFFGCSFFADETASVYPNDFFVTCSALDLVQRKF